MNRTPFLLLCLSLFFTLLTADSISHHSVSSKNLNEAHSQPQVVSGHRSVNGSTVTENHSSDKKPSVKAGGKEERRSGAAQHKSEVKRIHEAGEGQLAVRNHRKEETAKSSPEEVKLREEEDTMEAQKNREGSKVGGYTLEKKQFDNRPSEIQKLELIQTTEVTAKLEESPKDSVSQERSKTPVEVKKLPLPENKATSKVDQEEEKEDIKIIPAEKKKPKTVNVQSPTKAEQSAKETKFQSKPKQGSEEPVKKVQGAEEKEKKVMTKPPAMPIPKGPEVKETKLPEKDGVPESSQDKKTNTSQHSRHDEPKREELKQSDIKIISLQSDKQPSKTNEGETPKSSQTQDNKSEEKGSEKQVQNTEKAQSHITKDISIVQVEQSDKKARDNLSKEEKIQLLINEVKGNQPLSSQSRSQVIKILQASKELPQKNQFDSSSASKQTQAPEPILKLQQMPETPEKEGESDKQFLESKQMSTATIVMIIVLTFLISIPIFRQIRTHNTQPSLKRPQSAQNISQTLSRDYDSVENEPSVDFGQSLDEEE